MSDGDGSAAKTLTPMEQAALDKAQAEARSAAIAANRAEFAASQEALNARVPTATAKPLEGKIAADEHSGYVADLAAYQAVELCAVEIAKKVGETVGTGSVLLVDTPDLSAADAQYFEVRDQLETLLKQIAMQQAGVEALLQPVIPEQLPTRQGPGEAFAPAGEAPVRALAAAAVGLSTAAVAALAPTFAIAAGATGAVADIVGYFRTDWDVKGREVAIGDGTVRTLVASELKRLKKMVFMQRQRRLDPEGIIQRFSSGVTERIQLMLSAEELKARFMKPAADRISSLQQNIDAAAEEIEKYAKQHDTAEVKRLQAKVDGWKTEQKAAQEEKAPYDVAYARATAVIAVWDEFAKTVSASAAAGLSPLACAAIQERIEKDKISHLLFVAVVSSGGEVMTGRRYFLRPKYAFLGGSAVTYSLTTVTGELVAAGLVSATSCADLQIGTTDPPHFVASVQPAATAKASKIAG
jgi:hypothetical protein